MAKLALFLVLALVAVQSSYARQAPLQRYNDIEEVVEEIAVITKDVQKISTYVARYIGPIIPNFEHSISGIVEEHHVYPILAKLQEDINEIASEASDESEGCVQTARHLAVLALENSKRETDDCLGHAEETTGLLTLSYEDLVNEVTDIQEKTTRGYHQCITATLVEEDIVKCLKSLVDSIKPEVEDLEKKANDALERVKKMEDDGQRHLNECMQKVKYDTTVSSNSIVGNLRRCVQVVHGPVIRRDISDIFDWFRNIKEKIEYIIHLASHLPTSISEIPDKINEIISHINISALISQIKSEIADAVSGGGNGAEECKKIADKKVDDLVEASEGAAKACMSTAQTSVQQIEDKVDSFVDKGKALLDEVNDKTLSCFLENKLNVPGFIKCLEKESVVVKQKFADLQKEVSAFLESAKRDGETIIRDLAKCMNKVQLDTINKGQVLLEETEKCIRDGRSYY